MGNLKKIGTFREFIQKNKTLKENKSQIAVDVPFWDEAIGNVMSDLHSIAGTPIDFSTLIDYVKIKQIILGKDLEDSNSMIIDHIKYLLFNYYGQSYFVDDTNTPSGHSYIAQSIATKSLVISQLSEEIFKQVKIDAGIFIEPAPEPVAKPVASVSLDDNGAYYDDLPFENRNAIKNYETYTSLLNESITTLSFAHKKECIDDCINKIKKDAGSLNYDDVAAVAFDKDKSLEGYIAGIVKDYVSKHNDFKLDGEQIEGKDQTIVLKQARELFAYQMTKDLMGEIQSETQGDEKVK